MKKSTKQKCNLYVAGMDACNFLVSGRMCKCMGDKCWLIKAKLNTKEKLAIIKKLNERMKNYNAKS